MAAQYAPVGANAAEGAPAGATSVRGRARAPGARCREAARRLPARLAALLFCGASALLLALRGAPARLGRVTVAPPRAPLQSTGLDAVRLSEDDRSGEAPPAGVACPAGAEVEGAPQRAVYYSAAQAFRCMDRDGSLEVTPDEMGPGHWTSASCQWEFFLQKLQREQGDAVQAAPSTEAKVGSMAQRLLDNKPTGPELVERELQRASGRAAPAAAPVAAPVADGVTEAAVGDEKPGIVSGLFTFGAPPISEEQVLNVAAQDGCFPGLRIYSVGTRAVDEMGLLMRIADPVAWMLSPLDFKHPRSAAMSLDVDSLPSSGYSVCAAGADGWHGPMADMFFWFDGHGPGRYQRGLADIVAALNGSSPDSMAAQVATGVSTVVSSNESAARESFAAAGLEWTQDKKGFLGKKIQVRSMERPGVVGLCVDRDWECTSVTDFPVDLLNRSSPERLLRADQAGDESAVERLGEIGSASQYADLSLLAYQDLEQVNVDTSLPQLGLRLVERARGSATEAILFQKSSMECVLSFGMLDPSLLAAQGEAPGGPGPAKEPSPTGAVDRQLFYWWMLLQGRPLPPRGAPGWREALTGFSQRGLGKDREDPASVVAATTFCGFRGVQRLLVNITRDLLRAPEWETIIKPALPKCRSVNATGHGFGGAMATLWAACANSNRTDQDFSFASWRPGEPERLKPMFPGEGNGMMIRNRRTKGLLMDLQGLLLSDRSPDGAEQKWVLDGRGRLISNQTSGCLTAIGFGGVAAKPCDELEGPSGVGVPDPDLWEWAGRGTRPDLGVGPDLLVHKRSRQCLSASLRLERCPLTAQTWVLAPQGLVINRVSGKCLTAAEPAPGNLEGAPAVIASCKHPADPSQQFNLTADGRLKSRGGLCLDINSQSGTATPPHLALLGCAKQGSKTAQRFNATVPAKPFDKAPGIFIVSELTLKCLDTWSDGAPKDGDWVVLRPCEFSGVAADTNALWELQGTGQLVNCGADRGLRNSCLGVSSAAAGSTAVLLDKCDTLMRLKWNLTSGGQIRTHLGSRQCIAADDESVHMDECEKESSNQSWFWSSEGFLYNVVQGKCMDVAPDGRHLVPAKCELSDQKWRMTPEGFIESQLSGLCMDVKGDPPVDMNDGAQLVLYSCEKDQRVGKSPTGTDQVWTLTKDGLLRNRFGEERAQKCVGVRNGVPVNGKPLVLTPCTEGGGFTPVRWNLTHDGFFVRVTEEGRDRKCIDVYGPAGQSVGQPLVLWKCEDATNYTYQAWEPVDQQGRPLPDPLGRGLSPARLARGNTTAARGLAELAA